MFEQCVFRFLFGGVLMLVIYLVGQKSGDFAGLLSAAPIFSGAILLSNMTQGQSGAQLIAQTSGSVAGMFCGLAFYVAACLALRCKTPPTLSFALACAACVLTYVVVSFVKRTIA